MHYGSEVFVCHLQYLKREEGGSSSEMEFEHPLHEHKLIHHEKLDDDDEQYVCSGCTSAILPGDFYICSQRCKFSLHTVCAVLPKTITHFLHAEHPLIYLAKSPYAVGYFCDNCRYPCEGFLYHCSLCNFDLDIDCALSEPDVQVPHDKREILRDRSGGVSETKERAEEELQHHLHEHPLLLVKPKYDGKRCFCSGCTASIVQSGLHYVCREDQCEFSLHEYCSRLPEEITLPSHPSHPLTLYEKHPCIPEYPHCASCEDPVKGFLYLCLFCGYSVDTICASAQRHYVDREDHKHTFVLLKPTSFRCDVCGDQNRAKSNLCTSCQVQVHESCAFLPLRAKLVSHQHPLKLTSSLQLKEPIESLLQFCTICCTKIDTSYGFYYCEDCGYIADIKCGTAERYRDYQFDEAQEGTVALVEEKIDLEWFHSHGLILCSDKLDVPTTKVCYVCVSLISTPYYHCLENCGFALHESCAKLPKTVYHPIHVHPLSLEPNPHGNSFRCKACRILCNGYKYNCKSCEFWVDVKCVTRSAIIRNEKAHKHPLRVIREKMDCRRECKGCRSECGITKYRCIECDHNVCFKCIGLPISAEHNWDEHPVMLTYESIEHECEEYYCDQCEKPRDPKHWFFHCESCERDVHISCMGLHNLNLKRTYERDDPHPLTLIANPQLCPPCTTCELPCKDFYYQCLDCKRYSHLWSSSCSQSK